MARSIEQLEAWAKLLDLCNDGCEVFSTTEVMRESVIEVEKELGRLHKIEDIAIILVRKLNKFRTLDVCDPDWDFLMDAFWNYEKLLCKEIVDLIPEAFTERNIYEWLPWQKVKLMELRDLGHTYEDIGRIIDKTNSQCRSMWAHENQKQCSEYSEDAK